MASPRDTLSRLRRRLDPLRERRDAASSLIQQMGLAQASQLAARRLGEPAHEGVTLQPWQRRTLEALIARIGPGDDDSLPGAAEVGALDAALDFASHMPEVTHRQLLDLLSVFEAGVSVLGPERHLTRFTALDAAAQDAYIRLWEQSALEPMRAAFHGLKSVCMMGYWTRQATWSHIGYDLHTELDESPQETPQERGEGR